MKRYLATAVLLWAVGCLSTRDFGDVQVPVLNWQHGGCYSSWCEAGWYSSVAVADLDADGAMEVVASVYDRNGNFYPGWPQQPVDAELRSLAAADLDQDGDWRLLWAGLN